MITIIPSRPEEFNLEDVAKDFKLPGVSELFEKIFGENEKIISFDGPYFEGVSELGGMMSILRTYSRGVSLVRYNGEDADGYFDHWEGNYKGIYQFLVGGFGCSMQGACRSLYVREKDREFWEDEFPELMIVGKLD